MRTAMLVAAAALGLSVSLNARPDLITAGPSVVLPSNKDIPGARLPIVKDRRYVMSGAVRPLLFWMSRDDIGLGRIVWRRSEDGARGYEFLVGTDPARAPRGINRWGFVSEETLGSSGAVLALMTGSHDTSYQDEADSAAQGDSGAEFRTIRSTLQNGETEWQLAHVRTRKKLNVHHVENAVGVLLENAAGVVRPGGSERAARRRPVAPGVRPGFLVAVADLVDATIAAAKTGAARAKAIEGVPYVFGERTYELRVRDVERAVVTFGGREMPVLKTSFQTREIQTGGRTRFDMTIGTSGDAVGVPLSIEWQPRWWLKVRLRLADPPPTP